MNKEDFLSKTDVEGFVDWLSCKLLNVEININILPSRFVPGGLEFNCIGINELSGRYIWASKWTDSKNNTHCSNDWSSTQNSLARLRVWINDSLESGRETDLYDASIAVLEWGGVKSARFFLKNLAEANQLVGYLSSKKTSMSLDNANLNNLSFDRFDSGLTKVHALLSEDGLPIYDSRVAAVICAFVYLYREETNMPINNLLFPASSARGKQIRNLRCFQGGNVFPRLYSQASDVDWGRAQVKLGWIFQSVLKRNQDLFPNENGLIARMYALEASFFMLGYDLRAINGLFVVNLVGNPIVVEQLERENSIGDWMLWGQRFNGYRVPTVHNFTKVMTVFLQFRTQHPNCNDLNLFSRWVLENSDGINTKNSSNAFRYPLTEGEMGIKFLADNEIQQLVEFPNGEFAREMLLAWQGCDVDDLLPNSIADVFIAGRINQLGRQLKI
jgi:hypothetical protein